MIEANPRVVGASGGAEKNRWTGRLASSAAASTSTARKSGDWHSCTCSIVSAASA